MKKAPAKMAKKSPAKAITAKQERMAKAILAEKDSVAKMKKAAMMMKKAAGMKLKMKKK